MKVQQLFDLTGQVAIVTGGSIGLGRQMAEGLAEAGANLVLCARKKERCEQAAGELQKLGVKTLAVGCDVKNPANVQEVVDATLAQFGRIDILINNAGTSWGAPVEEMRLEHWNKVIETNLTGTFLYQHHFGRGPSRRAAGISGDWLPREQRRGDRVYERPRLQVGDPQHPGERHRSRMVSDKHVAGGHRAE